jgi:hypothetical protein
VLVNAINAASWNGAGAESVSLTWIFIIDAGLLLAMLAPAQTQPILQPSMFEQLIVNIPNH